MLQNLTLEESGQGMAEYALIIFLIAIACVVAFQTLPPPITGWLDEVAVEME